MDPTDADAREDLLLSPLRRALEASFTAVSFTVDAAAALQRPGEPIHLEWQDGPTEHAVKLALAPTWSTEPGPEDASHERAYPVTTSRRYSPTALACALILLHDRAGLEAAVSAGQRAFDVVLGRLLRGRTLPTDWGWSLLARGEILANVLASAAGAGAFTQARWCLGPAGTEFLTVVMPGALGSTRPDELQDAMPL